MTKFILKKPLHWVLGIIAAFAILFIVVVVGIYPYSKFICTTKDIDVHSGRIREQQYLMTFMTSSTTQDSWITESLKSTTLEGLPSKWRRANTFTPFRSRSANHTYRGAIEQIQSLEQIDQTLAFEPEARRTAARRVLGMWRNGGSPQKAQKYVDELSAIAEKLSETPAKAISISDLP